MLPSLLIFLRSLLSVMGAAALLFFFSYPDTLLPPNPDVDYVEGVTLYDFKPVIWLLPALFMELVSLCGPRRNFVWFTGLLSVFLVAVVAFPVLKAWEPEWVVSTFGYEDGKLTVGLCYFAIFILVSVVIRCGLGAYLFHENWGASDEGSTVQANVLDPSKALTVREIAALPQREAPRFLFGDADQGVIHRFVELMRRLGYSKLRRLLLFFVGLLALVGWFFFYPQPSPQEALHRDLTRMYEHVELPNGSLRATRAAVHAAVRVLRRVSDEELFAGMSVQEAESWLRLDQAPRAYLALLRDSSELELASTDALFESRTRFFTVSDGKRTVVLFVRMNADDSRINVSEMVDAGWNAKVDLLRRRFGSDISARFFSR